MKHLALVLALGICLFGNVNRAQATLIEGDLFAVGDGLLTLDTDTGLEWLDLTETDGLLLGDVLAGAGDYTTTLGFDFASEALVRELVANAGVTHLNAWGTGSTHVANVRNILDLMGVTWEYATIRDISLGYFDNVDPFTDGTLSLDVISIPAQPPEAIANFLDTSYYPPDFEDYFGTFLVRQTGVGGPLQPVPEPATLSLLGMGLVGLLARSRRAKR